jgi:acetaldehyde dehydrogenase (acetylating)
MLWRGENFLLPVLRVTNVFDHCNPLGPDLLIRACVFKMVLETASRDDIFVTIYAICLFGVCVVYGVRISLFRRSFVCSVRSL